MQLTIKMFALLTVMTCLISCGGGEKSTDSGKATTAKAPAQKDAMAETIKAGKKLFVTHCSACHMVNGVGIPGLNPPLVDTDWVKGDKDRLIGIVLNGLTEEIEVNGQKYKGPMIGLPYLKDEEVASILTYVRDRFGKGASSVTADEVAKVRG